jgi:mRNA interferase MazF
MRRGEIYWADLAPRSGSEQKGRRLVVVVSRDDFNRIRSWRSLIVVPLSTSPTQAGRGPTAIPVPGRAGGLGRASVALCHQVTTIDRTKIDKRIGMLSAELLHDIGNGLRAALDLGDER